MTTNEINFCEYFEKTMLPNRRNITIVMLKQCERLLGGSLGIEDCTSCMHRVAVDLMNLYNRLLPFYQEYKDSLIPVEEKKTVVEDVVVEDRQVPIYMDEIIWDKPFEQVIYKQEVDGVNDVVNDVVNSSQDEDKPIPEPFKKRKH